MASSADRIVYRCGYELLIQKPYSYASKKTELTITVFEALEKAIQQREKIQQSKDVYYQSEEHKRFYSLCKGIPFYRWDTC